jgi:hypothetical protein
MYGIIINGCRVGTVMKLMGEPAATRWYAFVGDSKQGFRTKREAVAWIVEQFPQDEEEN